MKNHFFKVILYIIYCNAILGCSCGAGLKKNKKIKLNEIVTIDRVYLNKVIEKSYDSKVITFNFSTFHVLYESGYHCNNFYESDLIIVHPFDTVQINNLKKENIEFILTENKNEIDLDYYRKSNVFFDTISNFPCKIIKPRKRFEGPYIYYFDSIYYNKSNKLNQCMYFKSNDIKNKNDEKKFENFVRSIKQ